MIIFISSGQALFTTLKLRSEGLVPAASARRACATSTPLSSARQTFPSGLPPAVKDCFGLHGHSAFGYVANRQIGVGRKSVASDGHTTDPFHSLQAGKTVDISRCASEINRLSSPSALPRLLRSLRLFPPARPAAGRLPADAGHRAAVVDCDAIAGTGCYRCLDQSRYQRRCRILPTSVVAIYRDLSQYPMRSCCTPHSAIGDFETFDNSRLRRNFASYQLERQCRASVVHSHYGLQRQCCGRESRKAVSCCLYAGRAVKEEPQAAGAADKGIWYARQSRRKPPQTRILYAPIPGGVMNGQAPAFEETIV